MDVGCYCVSAARMLAGEPVSVTAQQLRAPSGVDRRAGRDARPRRRRARALRLRARPARPQRPRGRRLGGRPARQRSVAQPQDGHRRSCATTGTASTSTSRRPIRTAASSTTSRARSPASTLRASAWPTRSARRARSMRSTPRPRAGGGSSSELTRAQQSRRKRSRPSSRRWYSRSRWRRAPFQHPSAKRSQAASTARSAARRARAAAWRARGCAPASGARSRSRSAAGGAGRGRRAPSSAADCQPVERARDGRARGAAACAIRRPHGDGGRAAGVRVRRTHPSRRLPARRGSAGVRPRAAARRRRRRRAARRSRRRSAAAERSASGSLPSCSRSARASEVELRRGVAHAPAGARIVRAPSSPSRRRATGATPRSQFASRLRARRMGSGSVGRCERGCGGGARRARPEARPRRHGAPSPQEQRSCSAPHRRRDRSSSPVGPALVGTAGVAQDPEEHGLALAHVAPRGDRACLGDERLARPQRRTAAAELDLHEARPRPSPPRRPCGARRGGPLRAAARRARKTRRPTPRSSSSGSSVELARSLGIVAAGELVAAHRIAAEQLVERHVEAGREVEQRVEREPRLAALGVRDRARRDAGELGELALAEVAARAQAAQRAGEPRRGRRRGQPQLVVDVLMLSTLPSTPGGRPSALAMRTR